MAERMAVLTVAFGGMLLYDWLSFKNKINKREKVVYSVLLLIGLYLGLDYALNKDWPDYADLFMPVIGDVSREIDQFLNVNQ